MMPTPLRSLLLLGTLLLPGALYAGTQISEPSKVALPTEEKRTWFPDDPAGLITVGSAFSEHLSGVYLDSITGLYASPERDLFVFLNSRYHYEDNGQFLQNTGLGVRKLFPAQQVIVGFNAYYDALHSAAGNDFDQLGLGAEVLTRWVDFRFNYYLPEDQQFRVDHSSDTTTSVGGGYATTRKRNYQRFESALEGLNTELGFLVPGLDKYLEVRVFAGYHHYESQTGDEFSGFHGRLEARLLPGVIADVEYWDDKELMGGHWTAGVRVSVPFSLWELAHGRNPFEGLSDEFRPRQREFSERMSEMVIRSHRVQAVTSSPRLVGTSTSRERLGGGGSGGGSRSGGQGNGFFVPFE